MVASLWKVFRSTGGQEFVRVNTARKLRYGSMEGLPIAADGCFKSGWRGKGHRPQASGDVRQGSQVEKPIIEIVERYHYPFWKIGFIVARGPAFL